VRKYLDDCAPQDWRGFMVRTERWKYLLWEGYDPPLFDLDADPDEFAYLGTAPAHAETRAELHERLFAWPRARRTRITISEDTVRKRTGGAPNRGIIIGEWTPEETVKGDPESDYWFREARPLPFIPPGLSRESIPPPLCICHGPSGQARGNTSDGASDVRNVTCHLGLVPGSKLPGKCPCGGPTGPRHEAGVTPRMDG
jgi:hypothetical protein